MKAPADVVPLANPRFDIEAFRIVSIFGIVWFHCGSSGRDLAYSGLIVFLILSIYLSGSQAIPPRASIDKRFRRLIVPWAVWFSIYGIVNLVRGKPLIDQSNGLLAGTLSGPSNHLWYLPYIFFALLGMDAVRRIVKGQHAAYTGALLGLLAFLTVPVWRVVSVQLADPWAQYVHALPGLFLGLFFLNYHQIPQGIARVLVVTLFAAACLRMPYPGIGLPYSIGICAGFIIASRVVTTLQWPGLAKWGRNAFGVYLIHIFFLLVVAKLNVVDGALTPISVFVLSFLAVTAFRRAFPGLANRVL